MEEEKKEEVVVDDSEALLDKELEETISAIKAGQPEAKKEETPTETKVEESPATLEEKSEEAPKEGYEFRIPNKGKFESDESYEKRIELLDLVKRRKLAKTEEQKQQISTEIQVAKSQMKTLNGLDKNINNLNTVVDTKTKETEEEDEALKADRERLKQLGGATKEDIQEMVRQERIAVETKSTLDKFVDKYADFKDTDVREVFFDFVDANYNWQNKTGKELMTVLELARESMFRPSESIQERVLKGANVAEKINAMSFPGGSVAKQGYSPEKQQSINELMSTGMSEAKALELMSD